MAKHKRRNIKRNKYKTLMFVIVSIFCIANITTSYLKVQKEKRTYEETMKESQKVQKDYEKTIEEYEKLQDEEYLERTARANYKFVKDGEAVSQIME